MPKKIIKIKWPQVVNYPPLDDKPIVNWIDLGNGTMFRIITFFTSRTLNREHPREGFFVGLERVGCFLFDITRPKSWEYVSEKLHLPESDARPMADWINAQLGVVFADEPQQGEYSADYIMGVESYFLFGEAPSLPLAPEIIND